MRQDFENHPFFSAAFLLFLVLCSFFGAPLFYMPVLPLLALSTTLHDRYVDFWIGTWFQSVAVRKSSKFLCIIAALFLFFLRDS